MSVPNITCRHPFMVHQVGNAPIPPAKVVGMCEHNYHCPVCGHGRGQYPDPCHQAPRDEQKGQDG